MRWGERASAPPRRARSRYHLASALDQQSDHPAALQELETALKSNPSKNDEQNIKQLIQKISK